MTPLMRISYSTTPLSSVDPVKPISSSSAQMSVPPSLTRVNVGVVGGVASALGAVVAVTVLVTPDAFPAASRARTANE